MTHTWGVVMRERSGTVGAWMMAVLCLIAGGLARAHEYRTVPMQRYTVSDGLSHLMAFCVTQDRSGFIWIGTEDGLNRFDGQNFSVFRRHEGANLTDQRITTLLPLANGDLLIGTYRGGLCIYRHYTGAFEQLRDSDGRPVVPEERIVTGMAADADGVVWIGTMNGLFRYQPGHATREFRHNPEDATGPGNNVILSVIVDHAGALWAGTNDGLFRCQPGTETFERFDLPARPDSIASTLRVRSLFEDREGNIWAGVSAYGLYRLTGSGSEFEPVSLTGEDGAVQLTDNIMSISEDHNGYLWIGTYGDGVYAWRPGDNHLHHFHRDQNNTDSLANNRVWQIFTDTGGSIWISTHTGISKINPQWDQIELYRNDALFPGGRLRGAVWGFHEGGHPGIWIATDAGISIFDRARGTISPLPIVGGIFTPEEQPIVRTIVSDGSTGFWLGTDRHGLLRITADGRLREHLRNQIDLPSSIANDSIFSLLLDSRGSLWVGTFGGGISRRDRGSTTFQRYRKVANSDRSLSDNAVWTIFEDPLGRIWIGTYDGLNRYEPTTDDFVTYRFKNSDHLTHTSNSIYAIATDGDSGLWLGTDGGGLIRFSIATGTHQHYILSTVREIRTIYGILPTADGDLWLSTGSGLVLAERLDSGGSTVPDLRFIAFSSTDGLQDEDFNLGAAFRSVSGELYFGGSKGFNIISPTLADNLEMKRPQIVISDIRVNQQPILPGVPFNGRLLLKNTLSQTERIVLNHNENFFSVSFACLDYIDPTYNVLSYRMVGIMQDWRQLDASADADFILAPGEYTLEVRGANARGLWNETDINLAISVMPPFFETWWFRSLLVLCVIGGAIAIAMLRTRAYRARNRKLEEINSRLQQENTARKAAEDELRHIQRLLENKVDESIKLAEDLEAFDYSVSNAIRVPLRISAGFAELLQSSCAEKLQGEPQHYLATLQAHLVDAQRLVDDLLLLSRASREEMLREPLNLSVLARTAVERAVRNCDIPMPRVVIEDGITCRGDYRFLQIALNILLENAVIYSAEKPDVLIEFGVRSVEGRAEYFVRDNGIGFEQARAERLFVPFHSYHTDSRFGGQGLGLATVQRIIKRHGGTIRAEGIPGQGATFFFTLGDGDTAPVP